MNTKIPATTLNLVDYSTKRKEPEPQKILIYGAMGSGKTYSLKTLPKSWFPAVLLDIERGSRALEGQFEEGEFLTFLLEDQVANKNGVLRPVAYAQSLGVVSAIQEGELKCNTLIIDSITRLYNAILDFGLKDAAEDKKPGFDEWGAALRSTIKFVQLCAQLNKNIIFIGHEKAHANEVTGIEQGVPALSGQLGTLLPTYFDEVLHTIVQGRGDKRAFYWETSPTGKFVARTRHPEFPSLIEQDFSIYQPATPAT